MTVKSNADGREGANDDLARPPVESSESLDALVKYAFAPVHKAALGVAFGLTAGILISGVTILQLLLMPHGGPPLALLAQFFYGYKVSWSGAAVGFFWAFLSAFVAGWFLAFLKNLFTAVWMFAVRTKAELSQPFLDHI